MNGSPSSQVRLARAASVSSMGLAVGWLLLILLTGRWIGPLVLGDAWADVRPIVLAFGLYRAVAAAVVGAEILLRSRRRAGAVLRLRYFTLGGTAAAALLGSLLAGVAGAVWALGVFELVNVAVWWRSLQQPLPTFQENAS